MKIDLALIKWLTKITKGAERNRLRKAVYKRLWGAQGSYVDKNNMAKIAYKRGYEEALIQVLEMLEEGEGK